MMSRFASRAAALSAIATIVAALAATPLQAQDCASESGLKSASNDVAVELSFRNASAERKRLYWIDFEGRRKFYAVVEPSSIFRQPTLAGHPWVITDDAERCQMVVMPGTTSMMVDIGGVAAAQSGPPLGTQQPIAPPPVAAQPAPVPPRFLPAPAPAPVQLRCGPNYQLINGNCVLKQNCGANAYRSPEGDCYCRSGFVMRGGQCINSNVAKGYEAAPWKKPGCGTWKSQCDQGNARACATYESTCQVN